MSGYIGSVPIPQASQTRDNFTATAGQTTFSTSGYTPNYLDVYLNGVHLDPSDYTATNGTDVVLDVGATAGDTVTVLAFKAFEVAGIFTAFPFYKADGTSDTISITNGSLPFFKANGSADNIGVS